MNIAKSIKKMSINEVKDFISENQYKRIGFLNNSSQSMKLKRLYIWKNFLEKKRFITNKLIEEMPEEKQKGSKTISNNYLSTKHFWHCWYKINYYKASKNST